MQERYFAETVGAANRIFGRAAERAGAVVHEYLHPARDPAGEPIRTLAARLGPERPEHMLALVSGTHGIEGHAGAALQAAFLDQWRERGAPREPGILFVHLVNPWGCAWNRRENEENVDVFRNLVYTTPPFANNPLYDRYEAGINPRAWSGPKRAAADEIFQAFIDAEGWETVLSTIRRGQHDYPEGITYHGREPSWSRRVVEQIGADLLSDVRNLTVLDIHTGYGEFGEPLIVPYDRPGSPKAEFVMSRFKDAVLIPGGVPIIPPHPRAPYELWHRPDGPRVLFVGLEWGTHDVEAEFELFRANTYIHTYGTPLDDFGRATSAAYRELFYPASPAWRETVLEKGLEIIWRTVDAALDADSVL